MENIKIDLKNGKSVTLALSMYFLSRCSQMLDTDIKGLYQHLLGVQEGEEMRGGIALNIHSRAVVIAAGMEAYGFANGDFTKRSEIDGYQVMNEIPDCLLSPIWGEISTAVMKAMIADRMPKEEDKNEPKKAVRKSPVLKK